MNQSGPPRSPAARKGWPTIRLVYIDDSGDDEIACYTALLIDSRQWAEAVAFLARLRRVMFEKTGVFVTKELHAREFISGRGRYAARAIDKDERARIAHALIRWYARIPSLQIINAVMDLSEKERCFDWLLNRIDTNMKYAGDQAIVISDEGKEYNAMLDRKRRLNDIPSMFGDWGGGSLTANIPIVNVVERIWYRDSKTCPFIQAADLCAYALFRKEKPLPSQAGRGIEKLFYELDDVLVKAANGKDPHGIVRWYK